MRKTHCFEVYSDNNGEWRWRLVAQNGRVVADGAEGYSSRDKAHRAVQNMRALDFARVATKTISPPASVETLEEFVANGIGSKA